MQFSATGAINKLSLVAPFPNADHEVAINEHGTRFATLSCSAGECAIEMISWTTTRRRSLLAEHAPLDETRIDTTATEIDQI